MSRSRTKTSSSKTAVVRILGPALLAVLAVAPSAHATDAAPVRVEIQVSQQGECTIVATPDEVSLWRNTPNKPNRGAWKWIGNQHGYERLYLVLEENTSGLGLCLPSLPLPPAVGADKRGFEITTAGTDSGAVSTSSTCVGNGMSYKYILAATKAGQVCETDPKVKIED